MQTRNARIGLRLFVFYALLYGAFVLVNAFSPETMEKMPLSGVNLAIVSGMALIVGALAIALVYGFLCKPEGDVLEGDGGDEGGEAS